MRNKLKIFIGLSMPALALAALWLWRLSRQQKQPQNNTEHNEQQNGVDMSIDGDGKTLLETLADIDDSESTQLPFQTGMSDSVSSEKGDSCDSLAESVSSDHKKEVPNDLEASPVVPVGGDEETWEVEFPQALCGRLIGKKGKNVQKISQITGTKIRLIPQKDNTESTQRLVSLTGTEKQLNFALKVLQEKFPSVPFIRLNGAVLCSPAVDCVAHRVVLPEQQMFNVFVRNIVDANHFYVQLYDQNMSVQGQLQLLDQQMYHCYNTADLMAATNIPYPVNTGMVCASQTQTGWWWRAQVIGLLMKPDEVEITWLDYGGKTTVPTTNLKQLRQDFMQLPFQAVECYLDNVVPHQGESSFSMTACATLEELSQSNVLTARITSYNRECPCLELYAPQWTGQPIFINRELVRRGCARWLEK